MNCYLPESVGLVLTLIMIGAGIGAWAMVSRRFDTIGSRKHPSMTFSDSHSRRNWRSAGMAVGLLSFTAVSIIVGVTARPIFCDALGTYRPPPDYSDYPRLQDEDFEIPQEILDRIERAERQQRAQSRP